MSASSAGCVTIWVMPILYTFCFAQDMDSSDSASITTKITDKIRLNFFKQIPP